MQIDVINVNEINNLCECRLYTSDRCVKMFISVEDYNELKRDGFFIRDGKEKDSAGVLNTSENYYMNLYPD